MGLNRKVGFLEGLKYQGGGPMLAWILHRLTALGIILFVGLHVVASFFMQQLGSDFATTINFIYESWIFQIIVAFCVIFHALNGLRIVICDLWPQSLMYQREILWAQWFIFAAIYGLTVILVIYINVTVG
jgi:succinate dehydrogenase / fumarate reductase cytochrome b subunit